MASVPFDDGVKRPSAEVAGHSLRVARAWAQHHAAVRRFIRYRVPDEAATDDLVQEAFLRLLRSPVWPEKPGAWLLTAARRLTIDHYRSRKPTASVDGAGTGAAEPADEPYTALAECLPAMLAQLPEPYRSAVEGADLDGLPQSAVAGRHGLSLSGAKSRIQRGRRLLLAAYHACCRFETAADGTLLDFAPRGPGGCVFSGSRSSYEDGNGPRNEENTVMKRITIEWHHLDVDGATCERCGETGVELRRAVETLNGECASKGVEVRLDERRLAADALTQSNSLFIDGRPIEALLPDTMAGTSPCGSCDDLIAHDGSECRTLERAGESHEAVPATLIRAAFCRIAACCDSVCDGV